MDRKDGSVHYHIRWAEIPLLDYESFNTRVEAEAAAQVLARQSEKYTIEEQGKNRSGGKQTEPVEFKSVELAKNAPFPEGFAFAHVSVANGYHIYSPKRGWIFYG